MTAPGMPARYASDVLTAGRQEYEARRDYLARIADLLADITTVDVLTRLWAEAKTAGVADKDMQTVFRARRAEITTTTSKETN
ncbi:hypothetical protein KIH27_02105 [Mycobacterium sp. M1]|uniref:Antitoxin VbhA domain-containing protein n=1 Tax=Mycolicibacter acidiphilus TaxID=2835306 RepID=A0ABS5RDL4_9MYCO|nr:hypothetical protein [Mycolicibacter acidiphilus]MBS9532378.1 hypothetical protein [Mycolicibacter acidiphilus]